jgi:hypothetical protein
MGRYSYSIGINPGFRDPERVLMFIEWLQSSQENYDLLMYGIRDTNHRLQGNTLDISGLDRKNVVCEWWGSEAFRNYEYERPYSFEPEDYKAFLEKCCGRNNLTYAQIYKKFGYDLEKYKKMTLEEKNAMEEENDRNESYLNTRFKVFEEFIERMDDGDFEKTLAGMMQEQGAVEGTEKLFESYARQLGRLKN